MNSKIILSISLLLSLISASSCYDSESRKTTENETKTVITAVSVSISGGLRAIPSKAYTITITEDSVHYRLYAIDTNQNTLKSYANTEQDWKSLLTKIDLEKFKNAQNGASRQSYDGIDTEITISTQNGKYLKINADNHPGWDSVYKQLVEIYYKKTNDN